ncbi:hypothetical protein DFS33DRAFT_979541 [Desarmillaria ectypa]|nr:hypothetical protein DFS33DRAFT_979541 [Desarmillaria ectypa]
MILFSLMSMELCQPLSLPVLCQSPAVAIPLRKTVIVIFIKVSPTLRQRSSSVGVGMDGVLVFKNYVKAPDYSTRTSGSKSNIYHQTRKQKPNTPTRNFNPLKSPREWSSRG